MKLALIDERAEKGIFSKLGALGYTAVAVPPSRRLDAPVASHPDMIFFPFGNKIICHSDYAAEHPDLVSEIALKSGRDLVLSDEPWSRKYPSDVLFNAAIIGDKIICRKKSVSKYILDFGFGVIDVNQGYAGCSTVTIGNRAIITADKGIANAVTLFGIGVLEITPGNIDLPGYEAGFIGGCTGFDGNTVFFIGDVSKHPDGWKIRDFCNSLGFKTVCLSDNPLTDYGKILFI